MYYKNYQIFWRWIFEYRTSRHLRGSLFYIPELNKTTLAR